MRRTVLSGAAARTGDFKEKEKKSMIILRKWRVAKINTK